MTLAGGSAQDPGAGGLGRQVRDLLRPHLQVRRFTKGSLLWREGETTGMLVAIRSGRVKIYRNGSPYPAYAQAIEEVEAEVMARSMLLQALRAEPELAAPLLSLLGKRLRDAFDLVQSLSTPGARARDALPRAHGVRRRATPRAGWRRPLPPARPLGAGSRGPSSPGLTTAR